MPLIPLIDIDPTSCRRQIHTRFTIPVYNRTCFVNMWHHCRFSSPPQGISIIIFHVSSVHTPLLSAMLRRAALVLAPCAIGDARSTRAIAPDAKVDSTDPPKQSCWDPPFAAATPHLVLQSDAQSASLAPFPPLRTGSRLGRRGTGPPRRRRGAVHRPPGAAPAPDRGRATGGRGGRSRGDRWYWCGTGRLGRCVGWNKGPISTSLLFESLSSATTPQKLFFRNWFAIFRNHFAIFGNLCACFRKYSSEPVQYCNQIA